MQICITINFKPHNFDRIFLLLNAYSLLSVRKRRVSSLSLAPLVSHGISHSICTPFEIVALHRFRSLRLFLTESRTPSALRSKTSRFIAFARSACFSRNLALPSSAAGSGRARFCRRHQSRSIINFSPL